MMTGGISDIKCEIPELVGDNYKVWKERILLHLGCLDIDDAIRKDEPIIDDESTLDDLTLHEQWERSNRLSMMFIKTKISDSIRGLIEEHKNVKALLKAIDEQFVTSDKALASTLIIKFTSMRLTTVKSVREHIIKIRDIAAQLKRLEVEMSKSFLVHYILATLPSDNGAFNISYNRHKEKLSINELMIMCVQKENRLSMDLGENALTVTYEKDYKACKPKGKGKILATRGIKKDPKEIRYFFCNKRGTLRNIAQTFQYGLSRKGMRNLRKPTPNEEDIYSENGMQSRVEAIEI